MKIALYYCGMIRTMKICYSTVFKLLKDHDVDVYLSIWDVPGTSLNGFPSLNNIKNIFPELEYQNINEELIKKEFPDLNFKVIDIENFEISKHIMTKYKHIHRIRLEAISNYYKINRCNKLRLEYQKANNIKYDWYIRIRPDNIIKKLPDLNKFQTPTLLLNTYVDEFLKISLQEYTYVHYDIKKDTSTYANQQFWMTNNENIMNITCNLYNNLDKYWNYYLTSDPIMGNYIKGENLIKYSKIFDFNVIILRSHGYCQIMNTRRKSFEVKHFYTNVI